MTRRLLPGLLPRGQPPEDRHPSPEDWSRSSCVAGVDRTLTCFWSVHIHACGEPPGTRRSQGQGIMWMGADHRESGQGLLAAGFFQTVMFLHGMPRNLSNLTRPLWIVKLEGKTYFIYQFAPLICYLQTFRHRVCGPPFILLPRPCTFSIAIS